MQKLFYNILLPVDLGKTTFANVEKAVQLANRLECNLHVLFTMARPVALENIFFKSHLEKKIREKRALLSELQKHFSQQMLPGSLLIASFQKGDVHEQTARYALDHSIDLVYYDEALSMFHSPYLDIHRLTDEISCPVLIGKSEPGLESLDKIVLPVDEQLSADHVRVAIFMAQQLDAAIHLVGNTQEGNGAKNIRYLTKAYELLKDNTGLELVCSTFSGNEKERSTLHYAQSVRAGLIVANRTKQAGFKGEAAGFLHGNMNRKDNIPVLLV